MFRPDGSVLLAKRTKPPYRWSFPGGAVEPGESAEDAAIREAREEVAIEIKIIAKVGEHEAALPDRRYIITVFAASLLRGEPTPGPEASRIGWFTPAEIGSLEATDKLEQFALAAQRLYFAAAD